MAVVLTGFFALIGSAALKVQLPGFNRKAKNPDIDLVCAEDTFHVNLDKFTSWSSVSANKVIAYIGATRFEILLDNNHPFLKKSGLDIFCPTPDIHMLQVYVASVNELFSLKRSHIHYPIHWSKSIYDYHYLKNHCTDWEHDTPAQSVYWYELSKVSERNKVKLKNQSKTDFFNQAPVSRIFDHDYLHTLVKRQEKPLYLKILKHGQEVECDFNLFKKLTAEEKLMCIREEAEVLALERCILPWINSGAVANIPDPGQKAYDWALMRLCTDITSGWFREFCVDQYFNVCILDNDLYNIALHLVKKEV